MRALVILDTYIPFPRANGVCLNNILQQFRDLDDVTIVCRTEDNNEGEVVLSNGWHVYTVFSKREKQFAACNSLEKICYCTRHGVNTLFGFIYDRQLAQRYKNVCTNIIYDKKPDVLISVLQPTAAVEAGAYLKKKNANIKFVIYDLDTAINSNLGKIERFFLCIYKNRVMNWERKVYNEADLVVHLDSHKEYFENPFYNQFKNKTIFQGIPLLLKNNDSIPYSGIAKRKKIKCLYAGAFYPMLREPAILLDVFKKIDGLDFVLDIYTSEKYRIQLLDESRKFNNIRVFSFVSDNEIQKIMQNSDILISLGNKNSKMFPSKIISYIAAMRPIIHFYQNDFDPVIDFLKDYKYALLVDTQNDINSNIKIIREFMYGCYKNLDFDWKYIQKKYYKNTPEYNAKEIYNLIRF